MVLGRTAVWAIVLAIESISTGHALGDTEVTCSNETLKGCSIHELKSMGLQMRINVGKLQHDHPVVFQSGNVKKLYKQTGKGRDQRAEYPELTNDIDEYAIRGLPFCAIDIYTFWGSPTDMLSLDSVTKWDLRFAIGSDLGDDTSGSRRIELILEARDVPRSEAALAKIVCISPNEYGILVEEYGLDFSDTELLRGSMGNYVQLLQNATQDVESSF